MLSNRVKMASITSAKSYRVILDTHAIYDYEYYPGSEDWPTYGVMYAINGGEWEPLIEVPTTLVDVSTIKFIAMGYDFYYYWTDVQYIAIAYAVISTTPDGSDIAYINSQLITETIDITDNSVFYCGINHS